MRLLPLAVYATTVRPSGESSLGAMNFPSNRTGLPPPVTGMNHRSVFT